MQPSHRGSSSRRISADAWSLQAAQRSDSAKPADRYSVADYSPHQLDQFARLEALLDPSPHNPHSLSIFGETPTRAGLRALPLHWFLWGRPTLVYDNDRGGDAVLEHELNDCRVMWRRTRDPKRREQIAYKARRTWSRLVELAIGLPVKGARWNSVVLFAD
jgi:hypothetical protein